MTSFFASKLKFMILVCLKLIKANEQSHVELVQYVIFSSFVYISTIRTKRIFVKFRLEPCNKYTSIFCYSVFPRVFLVCDSGLATDIVFLLDSSSGVGAENFDKMKTYVKRIVRSFDVDNQMSRFSVVSYDSYARVNIKFADQYSEAKLLDDIDGIRYNGGQSTRTDKALSVTYTDAFSEAYGARVGVKRVCSDLSILCLLLALYDCPSLWCLPP